MTKKTYSEKLRDPRWQQKRLKILERDKWQCRACLEKDKTLHVHHCYYDNNKEPWDYEDSSLVTLCFECHENETILSPDKKLLHQTLSMKGILCEPIHDLSIGFFHSNLDDHSVAALGWAIQQPEILNVIIRLFERNNKIRNYSFLVRNAAKRYKETLNG